MAVNNFGERNNVAEVLGDGRLIKYLDKLASDSKRKTIYARATSKAGIPIRRDARSRFRREVISGKYPRTMRRPMALRGGRSGTELIKNKSNLNQIAIRRGKRKYRGSAWVLGGPLANIFANIKDKDRVAKKGSAIPIITKKGKLIFVARVKAPKKSEWLKDATRAQKPKVRSIFKKELSTAILKHANRKAPKKL